MDPVTHVLLGATVSQAAFGRRLGWHAAAIGALAGLLPDSDAFIRSAEDPLLEIEYHRHFTHALLFAPVGAALCALPWAAAARFRARWRICWMAALLAWLSHCLLDASTTYGTLLFWPFSRHRSGWNLISIIDPLFTLTLLAGLVGARVKKRAGILVFSLGIALLYLCLGGLQQFRAQRVQNRLAAVRGHTIEQADVMPTLANNMVWRSLYRSGDRIHSDRIRVGWFSRAHYREGTSLPRVTARDLTPEETVRDKEARAFGRFAWFANGWVARAPHDPTVLGDMRYSLSMEAFDPIWGIRFSPPGASPKVEWVNRTRQRKIDARQLWSEITGGHPDYQPVGALTPEAR